MFANKNRRFTTLFVLVLISQLVTIMSAAAVRNDNNDFWDMGSSRPDENPSRLRLWLTISAQKRFLEISWVNAPALEDDRIMLTSGEPYNFEKLKYIATDKTPMAEFSKEEDDISKALDQEEEGSGFGNESSTTQPAMGESGYYANDIHYWISNNGTNKIVAALTPTASSLWFTTGVPFDYSLSKAVTAQTSCYGFWATYINGNGTILASTCLHAYPRWMNEMKSTIGRLRFRDLFIPGSHDSGSYRLNFNPLHQENLVTKYSLCQDDDIRGQLMHGIRYLDIRVGYHPNTPELFFINHGIVRQRPLVEIIDQVKEFVEETNEIIIFGLKEFPVGFGKNLTVHHKLAHFLKDHFGELVVHPSATWRATLNDIWSRKQNVILAYDKQEVVQLYPHLLFGSVEQRWGNVQKWADLEAFLRANSDNDVSRLTSRPVADMAELTPKAWDVILNKYGGLRKMADRVNWRVSQLYANDLAANANIVAIDYYRGTTIVETALDWNKRKIVF
ncbi:PI-PLC X domain-containing protein 2 isoform X3 [Stomoxys calcitrans]|uniref:PI-PLC X domain-containing protein 2 isoform X3 n=1 Tax=Stomoxys calcitrans TaxID=35570 RepID=UPI0027E2DAF0|nr:PI-PLC X domain-containing protein 2 isoform X3 [Stomoxys calcitrans]